MKRWYNTILSVTAMGLLCNLGVAFADDDDERERDWYSRSSTLDIERASWDQEDAVLYIKVKADKRQVIQIEMPLTRTRSWQESICGMMNSSSS